ncbi:MAG: rhamnulokinase [Clostridiales bacterium]|nr:rhamnulokinase [Clostridiales bacterium]
MNYYLAIDIGASSGRHILGCLCNGIIVTEEIYRFHNGMIKRDGRLIWDTDALFDEIITGIKLCGEAGKIPVSVGIDTWGVDYALLDKKGARIGEATAYRDNRTSGMDAEVFKFISKEELYSRTGIQDQIFNTIYQLMAEKKDPANRLDQTDTLLMMPDYLHWRLCGQMTAEYTEASTTGLVNAFTGNWDDEIIGACGYPRKIFPEIVKAGTVLGGFTPDVQRLVGFNSNVVLPAAHDTGSAVMAVPSASENMLYISSGTWSLMGVERDAPDCSEKSRLANFTNEGGYGGRIRYLRNIMGLWMIQSVRKELERDYSYAELCDMAEKEESPSIVNCDDVRFLSPESMINEIKQACTELNQPVPQTPGQLAASVYNSLAVCYRDTALNLEKLTGKNYEATHIVGGGSSAEYLNRLTARYTGKTVFAGPAEATAVGNLLAQMIAGKDFSDLRAARACVRRSFGVKRFN